MGRPREEDGHVKKKLSISNRCLKLVNIADAAEDGLSRYVEGLIKNDLAPVRVETSFQEHVKLLKQRGWGIRYGGTINVWEPVASHLDV